MSTRQSLRERIIALEAETGRLRSKLDEIREFVQQWQSAAENMDTGNLRMGDIAEVLDR